MHKPSALHSLTNTYSDSEESGSDLDEAKAEDNGQPVNERIFDLKANLTESRTNSPTNALFKSIDSLERREESFNEVADQVIDDNVDHMRPTSPVSFHKSLNGKSEDQIVIPPEPSETCAKALQDKIQRLHEKMKNGADMIKMIQKRKDFRNPSIYEKLIAYCGIDEMATNYPSDVYDPHSWTEKSFYEELSKRQKEEMDRRERERKERTKVEFMSGTKKDQSEPSKKKSKWDAPAASQSLTSGSNPNQVNLVRPSIVIPVTTATGTKPTVISAFGTIKKSK